MRPLKLSRRALFAAPSSLFLGLALLFYLALAFGKSMLGLSHLASPFLPLLGLASRARGGMSWRERYNNAALTGRIGFYETTHYTRRVRI